MRCIKACLVSAVLTDCIVFQGLLLVVCFRQEIGEHLVQLRRGVRLELLPQQLDRLVRAHFLHVKENINSVVRTEMGASIKDFNNIFGIISPNIPTH